MGLDQGPKSSLHLTWRTLGLWTLPVLLIGTGTVAAIGGDGVTELLRYDRDAVGAGQIWRLLSGHIVHLGWAHFWMNAAGLVLVWLLVGDRFGPAAWLLAAAVIVAVIDLGFWFLYPELAWYVGASGLLHGLLVAGAIAGYRDAPAETAVILVLLIGKLGFEQIVGPLPGSASTAGGPVVVAAHGYGAAGGLCAALILLAVRVRPTPPI